MSIKELKVLYEAVNTDRKLLPFYLFVEMVDEETDTQKILSWFKDSAVQH